MEVKNRLCLMGTKQILSAGNVTKDVLCFVVSFNPPTVRGGYFNVPVLQVVKLRLTERK
jgi:hypothetical protein